MKIPNPWFTLFLGLYCGVSKRIFDNVYDVIKVVIDEQFHIPQAQAYCKGRYDEWDSKITTLPGLYIAASNIIRPIADCNTYNLRFFNLVMSAVNMVLLYFLIKRIYGHSSSKFNISLQALNVTLLPPLYFFSHVFYTDTLSLTCLLLFITSVITQYPITILVFGICSIVTRQTNCVWLGMFFISEMFKRFIIASRVRGNSYISHHRKSSKRMSFEPDPSTIKRIYDYYDFDAAMQFHIDTKGRSVFFARFTRDTLCLFLMWVPNALFLIFIYVNGSIVVGDKDAHTISFHFAQLLYFLLFYGFFGLPFVLVRAKSTLETMWQNKEYVFAMVVAFSVIVHFNTAVHPYLLADNRHYTFYVWNRWFGKYPFAIYATIPAYVFLAFNLIVTLKDQNCVSFLIAYYFCLIPGLCLQRLLDLRYFIIPYIIARLRIPKSPTWLIVCEFLWYLAINAATFYVFFTKEIRWADFEEVQRIIW